MAGFEMQAFENTPEYSIYVFERPQAAHEPAKKWHRHSILKDRHHALLEAETLFQSGQYHKIEVKEKSFDAAKAHNRDTSIKIWQHTPHKNAGTIMAGCFAVFCGIIAFGATYIMTTGG